MTSPSGKLRSASGVGFICYIRVLVGGVPKKQQDTKCEGGVHLVLMEHGNEFLSATLP